MTSGKPWDTRACTGYVSNKGAGGTQRTWVCAGDRAPTGHSVAAYLTWFHEDPMTHVVLAAYLLNFLPVFVEMLVRGSKCQVLGHHGTPTASSSGSLPGGFPWLPLCSHRMQDKQAMPGNVQCTSHLATALNQWLLRADGKYPGSFVHQWDDFEVHSLHCLPELSNRVS